MKTFFVFAKFAGPADGGGRGQGLRRGYSFVNSPEGRLRLGQFVMSDDDEAAGRKNTELKLLINEPITRKHFDINQKYWFQ